MDPPRRQLGDGRIVSLGLCRKLVEEELAKIRTSTEDGAYEQAAELFSRLIEARVFPEFLTIPAYGLITRAS